MCLVLEARRDLGTILNVLKALDDDEITVLQAGHDRDIAAKCFSGLDRLPPHGVGRWVEHEDGAPLPVQLDGGLRDDRHSRRIALIGHECHILVRQQNTVRIRKADAHLDRTRCRIDRIADEGESPFRLIFVRIGESQRQTIVVDDRLRIGSSGAVARLRRVRLAFGAGSVLRPHPTPGCEPVLADRKGPPDRIELDDFGKRPVRGRHEIAFRDHRLGDDAVDRRLDRCIVEIELGLADGGFGLKLACPRRFERRPRLIELRLRNRTGIDELLRPVQRSLRLGSLGLRAGELRLRRLQ